MLWFVALGTWLFVVFGLLLLFICGCSCWVLVCLLFVAVWVVLLVIVTIVVCAIVVCCLFTVTDGCCLTVCLADFCLNVVCLLFGLGLCYVSFVTLYWFVVWVIIVGFWFTLFGLNWLTTVNSVVLFSLFLLCMWFVCFIR